MNTIALSSIAIFLHKCLCCPQLSLGLYRFSLPLSQAMSQQLAGESAETFHFPCYDQSLQFLSRFKFSQQLVPWFQVTTLSFFSYPSYYIPSL